MCSRYVRAALHRIAYEDPGEDEYEGDYGYERQRAAEHLLDDSELIGLILDQLKEDEGMIAAVRVSMRQEQQDDLREEIKEEMKEELEADLREEIKEEMREEEFDDMRDEVREEVREEEWSDLQHEVMQEVKAAMTDDERRKLARQAARRAFDQYVSIDTRNLSRLVSMNTQEGASLRAELEKLFLAAGKAAAKKGPKSGTVPSAAAAAKPKGVQKRK